MLEEKEIVPVSNDNQVEIEESIDNLHMEPDVDYRATPHDDFDWSVGKKNTVQYSKTDQDKYLTTYEKTLNSLGEYEVVKARVTSITKSDVLLDVNYKSDGLVPLSEFRDTPDLKVGDYVDVYIETKEDLKGQLVLSRRKAKLLKSWEILVDSYNNGTIIKGYVTSKTKGGLIVDCNGLETFLPGSQIDVKPVVDYDSYVGKTMEFKVVKINEAIKNAVVSHKALIESDLAEQREAIIAGLEKGQVLEGIVKNITDFGAFMDLGGVDGLLYITDISWGRITHPNEVLEMNQKINVVVLDFDEGKKRISLGLKQLHPHPWDVLDPSIVEGSTVKGKIVNIEDYGAFLEIIPGVEGLIHVSEVSWSSQPVNAREFFTLGTEYEAKVVTLDREERKMSLSFKQLTEDPWDIVPQKYPVESRHTGTVKNLTPYGVFVELESGIGGMIHISDLSWTKRFSHPSEFTKVGEKLDVSILELDVENRKLSLGHKQVEENPWDTFESVFPVGSYHEATVIKKDDRGATVQLPYGLEAYAPMRHLKKEDGSNVNVDETLTFKVIEFNRDDKRIVVSHSNYLNDIKKEAEEIVKAEKDKEKNETRIAVQKTNEKVEKATIGDLEVFSQLKEQIEESTKASAKKAGASKAQTSSSKSVNSEPEAKSSESSESIQEDAAKAVQSETTTKSDEVSKSEVAQINVDSEKKSEGEAKKTASKSTKASKTAKEGDNLKIVEGIGPKIEELLNAAGISTFAQLADTSYDQLQDILNSAGSAYKIHDPSTWAEQAALARDGKMDELKAWQDQLRGGKE